MLGSSCKKYCIWPTLVIWYHPKYYAELRKKRREHQAASAKRQASSVKHQATRASSGKQQAPSSKRQAPSPEQQDPE